MDAFDWQVTDAKQMKAVDTVAPKWLTAIHRGYASWQKRIAVQANGVRPFLMKARQLILCGIIVSVALNCVLLWRLYGGAHFQHGSAAADKIFTEMQTIADRNPQLSLTGRSTDDLLDLTRTLTKEGRQNDFFAAAEFLSLAFKARVQETIDKKTAQMAAIEAKYPKLKLRGLSSAELDKLTDDATHRLDTDMMMDLQLYQTAVSDMARAQDKLKDMEKRALEMKARVEAATKKH